MRCVERPLKFLKTQELQGALPPGPLLGMDTVPGPCWGPTCIWPPHPVWVGQVTLLPAKFLLSNLLSKHLTRTQSASVGAFSSSYSENIWKIEKTSETAVEYNLLNTELLSAVFGWRLHGLDWTTGRYGKLTILWHLWHFKLSFSENHSNKIVNFMLDVMCPIINDGESVPQELLDTVLVNIIEPQKVTLLIISFLWFVFFFFNNLCKKFQIQDQF